MNLKAKPFYPIEEVRYYASLLNVLSIAIETLEPINPPKAKELLEKCFSVMPLKELLNDEDFRGDVIKLLSLAHELEVIEDYQHEIDLITDWNLRLAQRLKDDADMDYRLNSRARQKWIETSKLWFLSRFLTFAIDKVHKDDSTRYVSSMHLYNIYSALLEQYEDLGFLLENEETSFSFSRLILLYGDAETKSALLEEHKVYKKELEKKIEEFRKYNDYSSIYWLQQKLDALNNFNAY